MIDMFVHFKRVSLDTYYNFYYSGFSLKYMYLNKKYTIILLILERLYCIRFDHKLWNERKHMCVCVYVCALACMHVCVCRQEDDIWYLWPLSSLFIKGEVLSESGVCWTESLPVCLVKLANLTSRIPFVCFPKLWDCKKAAMPAWLLHGFQVTRFHYPSLHSKCFVHWTVSLCLTVQLGLTMDSLCSPGLLSTWNPPSSISWGLD